MHMNIRTNAETNDQQICELSKVMLRLVQYEQQRHRNGTHTYTHIEHRARAVGREGSVQKIPILTAKYFLPSQWNPVLALLIHFRYGPKRCSHRTKCGMEPIRYVTLHFRDRRDATSLGPLQKSRPNHRSYVSTEALSDMVFMPAQEVSGRV